MTRHKTVYPTLPLERILKEQLHFVPSAGLSPNAENG
jgi:hypothetical protein